MMAVPLHEDHNRGEQGAEVESISSLDLSSSLGERASADPDPSQAAARSRWRVDKRGRRSQAVAPP